MNRSIIQSGLPAFIRPACGSAPAGTIQYPRHIQVQMSPGKIVRQLFLNGILNIKLNFCMTTRCQRVRSSTLWDIDILEAEDQRRGRIPPNTGEVRSDGAEGIAC